MNLFALAFRAMCLLMVATLLWNGYNLLNSASSSLFHSSVKENEVIILSTQRVSNQKAYFIAESIRQSKPPFYLHGKYEFLRDAPNLNRSQVRQNIRKEPSKMIGPNVTTWALPFLLEHPTRNHDNVVLEGGANNVKMVTILGRHSRYIQWLDLISGKVGKKRTRGRDPAGRPLDDLNHIVSVVVESLETSGGKEIWLPCGFNNDTVNSEESIGYVRIIDVNTMTIRTGPKLPISGGACVAIAWQVVQNEPPMVCSFAGTKGNHDTGTFLKQTYCYDRVRQRWWSPFGNLPFGLDHGSLAAIPAGTCHENDPARLLIFNFRTEPYGDPHPELLAYDVPKEGWTVESLLQFDEKTHWYVYHKVSGWSHDHPENVPRDASGIVVANSGRNILNFGGTYHEIDKDSGKRVKMRTSMIRSFDVCNKEWKAIGDFGLPVFALESCASEELQISLFCGGEGPYYQANSPNCFVSRWKDTRFSNE